MTTEIFLTVLEGDNRLVVSGKLDLLRALLFTFDTNKERGALTPDPTSNLATQLEAR